jgi:hypothetical protein
VGGPPFPPSTTTSTWSSWGFESWIRSCDRELRRQRCKSLRHIKQPCVFWKQKYFLLFFKKRTM